MCWVGLTQNPVHSLLILSRLIQILMDLDQSNAPGALVWSGSIRSVGLGFLPTGFWFSFNFLSFSAICTFVLANWTFCMPKILPKNSKFLLHVFYHFLGVLRYFSWKNWMKIWVCSFVLIGVRFIVFSAFRMRCSSQFCVMCLWYLMRVLCDILQYY